MAETEFQNDFDFVGNNMVCNPGVWSDVRMLYPTRLVKGACCYWSADSIADRRICGWYQQATRDRYHAAMNESATTRKVAGMREDFWKSKRSIALGRSLVGSGAKPQRRAKIRRRNDHVLVIPSTTLPDVLGHRGNPAGFCGYPKPHLLPDMVIIASTRGNNHAQFLFK